MRVLAAHLLALGLTAGTAHAQSSPSTCSYDPATRTVTVTVNGEKASLQGFYWIVLNGVICGDADVTNTDTVVVTGGALNDPFLFQGGFTPGATPETDGSSEIELFIDLGAGNDTVRWQGSGGDDVMRLSAGGCDLSSDGDQDVTIAASIENIRVLGSNGNDLIDASAYTGASALTLDAQYDSNIVIGSSSADVLVAVAGNNDEIHGGDGNDVFQVSAPIERLYGDGGNDSFVDTTGSWRTVFYGGAGRDTVDYSQRTDPVSVTLGNGMADDGGAGEEDNLGADVENAIGGSGNDVLVGSTVANTLDGGGGDDELYGGGGSDVLRGGDGADILVGDTGGDTLTGGTGDDSLDGGAGNDELHGGTGNDVLTGGAGTDFFRGDAGDDTFFNEDGVAETVDCGTGTADDPEPSATDTFVNCELI